MSSSSLSHVFTKALVFTACAAAAWAVALDADAQNYRYKNAYGNIHKHPHSERVSRTRRAMERDKQPEWYASINGGLSFVNDADFTAALATANVAGELNPDEGYTFGGAVGYDPYGYGNILNNMRFELELRHMDNDADRFESDDFTVTGENVTDYYVTAAMANIYFDFFERNSTFRPYIGAGAGLARISLNTSNTSAGETKDQDDTVFAYQGMAGINYNPESLPYTTFGVGYRYFTTEDPSFDELIFDNGSLGLFKSEYQAHILEANARFYF